VGGKGKPGRSLISRGLKKISKKNSFPALSNCTKEGRVERGKEKESTETKCGMREGGKEKKKKGRKGDTDEWTNVQGAKSL